MQDGDATRPLVLRRESKHPDDPGFRRLGLLELVGAPEGTSVVMPGSPSADLRHVTARVDVNRVRAPAGRPALARRPAFL